jgi:hypothetical protein
MKEHIRQEIHALERQGIEADKDRDPWLALLRVEAPISYAIACLAEAFRIQPG